MTCTNVTLTDTDGRTMTIRGCKDAEEVRYAKRHLYAKAINSDFREPYYITRKKMS